MSPPTPRLRRTSADSWRTYFERNARSPLTIPWELGPELTGDEIAAVASSLQEFQAGEYSEGRHLYQFARDYAASTGDYEYLKAIRLFIGEEQRHALHLARFLTLNGIPLVETTFADRVFRRLRTLVNTLEVSIAVLVTAELIAKVYYAVLRRATGSRILQRLCDQILSDEDAHVRFQCGQLMKLRANRGPFSMALTMSAQRLLYSGTVVIVGWSHRQVIWRGGLTLPAWWSSCWREFNAGFAVENSQPPTAVAHPTPKSVEPIKAPLRVGEA
jgi:hypothetical protein